VSAEGQIGFAVSLLVVSGLTALWTGVALGWIKKLPRFFEWFEPTEDSRNSNMISRIGAISVGTFVMGAFVLLYTLGLVPVSRR
jgi:hypothetical protein